MVTDVSELVKATEPSVVTVTRTRLDFDDLGGQTEIPTGTGSGVIVDGRGHVLTNAHVVAGAQDVLVVGFDGEPRRAQVVGTWGADQNSDLALLLLDDATGLIPIAMGDSRALEVGDPVVAIGKLWAWASRSRSGSCRLRGAKWGPMCRLWRAPCRPTPPSIPETRGDHC